MSFSSLALWKSSGTLWAPRTWCNKSCCAPFHMVHHSIGHLHNWAKSKLHLCILHLIVVLQKSHWAGCFFRYCSFAACCISSNAGCRHRMCAITAGGHFLVRSDNSGIETSDSGKSPMSTTVTSWKFRSRPRQSGTRTRTLWASLPCRICLPVAPLRRPHIPNTSWTSHTCRMQGIHATNFTCAWCGPFTRWPRRMLHWIIIWLISPQIVPMRERPLDFRRGGGGGIFSVTFRAKIFFSIYHEPEYFFSSHTGAEYFVYTIHIWKQLSVCVSDSDDFKRHNIADSKYIATQIYMRVYTPDVSCYWNLTFMSTISASPYSLKCNISMNNFLNRRIHMLGEYGTYCKIRQLRERKLGSRGNACELQITALGGKWKMVNFW